MNMAHKPFVEVCCNAISPTLFESELFDMLRSIYGASSQGKARYFEATGNYFLDEIGDISPEMQIKLLHVIQK